MLKKLSPISLTNVDETETRASPRFSLLLKIHKIIDSFGNEYLCIVRDISEMGVRLRLFHSIDDSPQLSLFALNGKCFPLELIWQKGLEAGFHFVDAIIIKDFISSDSLQSKSPIRLTVQHPAKIIMSGKTSIIQLHDLSRQGAKIETTSHLPIGQKLTLQIEELHKVTATVCWRQYPTYGLIFDQILGLEELARSTFNLRQKR